MNYAEAKQIKESLWNQCTAASEILNKFPKGVTGLTPDEVKSSKEWQAAKLAYDKSFAEVRTFNAFFTKKFKKEYAAERNAQAEAIATNLTVFVGYDNEGFAVYVTPFSLN